MPTSTSLGWVLWPSLEKTVPTQLILMLTCSAAIALLAQLSIDLPFTPVPITGQTLGVLLTGALLGSKRGALTLFLYLLEGLGGLPVFAGGKSGFMVVLGPTGGYLIGFIVAAFMIGYLCERGLDRTWKTALIPFLIGYFFIFLFGVSWLSFFVGKDLALTSCLLPFLPGAALKISLAAALFPSAWQMIRAEEGLL